MVSEDIFGNEQDLSLEEMIKLSKKVVSWREQDCHDTDNGWNTGIYYYSSYFGYANKNLKVIIEECQHNYSSLGNYSSEADHYKISVYSNYINLGTYKGKNEALASVYYKALKSYLDNESDLKRKKELDEKRKEHKASLEQQKREKKK